MTVRQQDHWKNTASLFGLAVLIGLLVCGARLWVIKSYGVQEPLQDSFGEIYDYLAAQSGDFHRVLENSLKPNNEHRILFTHWTNVALFLMNGNKWDLLSEAGLNAFLTGLVAFLVLYFLARNYSQLQRLGLGLLLVSFLPCLSPMKTFSGASSHNIIFLRSSL
jgi:hypothetical protein